MTKKYLNDLTYQIIGSAIEVHKALGPGLLESVYHKCLKQELLLRKLNFVSEFVVPVNYKGLELDAELRCDILVDDAIVVEIKAVDAIAPFFEAQLLTYMKLLKKPKGILINFNCANLFKEGQKTYVNEFFRELPEE
ncbi:MAG: GxxExxY protein [Ignavibacteriaceae bacterium]|nr:GxxExxY protein [Ignavibacterium sp.]MCU0413431.1 GxxExxY protein [Ignavibacteriaceae bacterium]